MSKPVSNTDVEDVLSSIRRLVSDNKGHGGAASPGQAPERLVLSPQQRVTDTDVLRLQHADAVHVPDPSDTGEDQPEVEPSDAVATADASPAERDGADDATPESRAHKIEALTAKIAALETAIAKTADQWEPDGASKDDYAGTQSEGMMWSENAELDATGKPLTSEEEPVVETPKQEVLVLPEGMSEEDILDEAALRDLVAEIVRSELQGALGERITRNVRKLVRREIHRALAARDLD